MACKPGTAGANELASLSRHAPLFTKTTARVPDPPLGAADDFLAGLLGCAYPGIMYSR